MTELLEEKGLKVLTVALPDRGSGLTCLVKRPDGQGQDLPVIVVNHQVSLERRRLTLAHELAHRLIDPDALADTDEETAATIFGGAFLMPRQHLLHEVGKHRNALGYRDLIDRKRLYRASGAAVLVRREQLGVISQSTRVDAFQTIARGWRTQEPEEIELPEQRGMRERARRFARLWYRALAEGLMSLLTVGHGSWRPSPPHGAPRLAARQVRPRATVVCERRRNERRTERTAFGTGRSRHRGKDATAAFGCVALRERHRQTPAAYTPCPRTKKGSGIYRDMPGYSGI